MDRERLNIGILILRCPVCLELPEKEVFQCRNGHSICGTCLTSLKRCPNCRLSFSHGKIRNRAVEGFLEGTKIACPFKSQGCNEYFWRRVDVMEHEMDCMFRPIEICKLVGYADCHFASGNVDEIIKHFMEFHRLPRIEEGPICCHISLHGQRYDSITPLGAMTSHNEFFVITETTSFQGRNLSFQAIHITRNRESSSKFQVCFGLNERGTAKLLTWRMHPVHYLEADEFFLQPPLQIPRALLKLVRGQKHYMSMGIFISKMKEKRSKKEIIKKWAKRMFPVFVIALALAIYFMPVIKKFFELNAILIPMVYQ